MDLEHAETVIALADHGTVSAAADALHVARPTVRRRVAALEERFGRKLVVITAHGAELTDAGTLYVQHARRLVRDHETLTQLIEAGDGEPTGLIDAAAPTGAAGPLGPKFLALAFANWPEVRVRLRATDDPVCEIYRGAHVAFALALPTDDELVVTSLGRVRIGLFASPSYLTREGIPRDVDALAAHTVLHAPMTGGWDDTLPLIDGGTVPITPRASMADVELVRACAAAGLGLALLPNYAAAGLTQVLPDTVGATRNVWCVTTRVGAELPLVRYLQRVGREFLKTHAPA